MLWRRPDIWVRYLRFVYYCIIYYVYCTLPVRVYREKHRPPPSLQKGCPAVRTVFCGLSCSALFANYTTTLTLHPSHFVVNAYYFFFVIIIVIIISVTRVRDRITGVSGKFEFKSHNRRRPVLIIITRLAWPDPYQKFTYNKRQLL